jgi:hypothetical protein
MAEISTKVLRIAVIFAIMLPIATFFYQQLIFLTPFVRYLVASLAIVILALGTYFCLLFLKHLGPLKLFAVALLTILGVLFSSATWVRFPSADDATVSYSDGSYADHASATKYDLWGRSIFAYFLHPAFSAVRVPNSLVARFTDHPTDVRVLFSKPQDALLMPDGSPTLSDGISVEVKAFNNVGQVTQSERFYIREDEFLQRHWIARTIKARDGISKLAILVGTGPPGSTPNYDATLVGLEARTLTSYAFLAGKVLFVGLAFFNWCVVAALFFGRVTGTRNHISDTSICICYVPYMVLTTLVVTWTYWTASKTSFVYFWDFRNYWQKTEAIFNFMKSGAWIQAANIFSEYYSADYSMLPAVLPATICLLFGYPNRINYTIIITVIYTLPAFVTTAYIAKKLLNDPYSQLCKKSDAAWVFASIPVFLGAPVFYGTTLYLMPDIGGVVFFGASLLCATSLINVLLDRSDIADADESYWKIFKWSLALGVLFSLMFLFRRWYVFAAVGIIVSCSAILIVDVGLNRLYLTKIIRRVFFASIVFSFAALPYFSWIGFDWFSNLNQHDYGQLYSSYKNSATADIFRLMAVFGLAVVFLVVATAVGLYRSCANRRLLLMLVFSTFVAGFLFLRVQSPGQHHYYLLMPLVGSMIAAFSITLRRAFGISIATLFTASLILASAATTYLHPTSTWAAVLFPQYGDWLPKRQQDAQGFREIADWLGQSDNVKKKFCIIASSAVINQGVFSELWQLVPSIGENGYDARLIPLGQVDSVNGPPSDQIKQCEIMLVGVPFQAHLKPGEQYTLQIIQEDIIHGIGIGKSFQEVPKAFEMDSHTKIVAYQRTQAISENEYADLVRRFWRMKQLGLPNAR